MLCHDPDAEATGSLRPSFPAHSLIRLPAPGGNQPSGMTPAACPLLCLQCFVERLGFACIVGCPRTSLEALKPSDVTTVTHVGPFLRPRVCKGECWRIRLFWRSPWPGWLGLLLRPLVLAAFCCPQKFRAACGGQTPSNNRSSVDIRRRCSALPPAHFCKK
jgi:hypothetical protein